jgi:hypothetical protein
VTNGTIFLLRRYVLVNVPFVIWRPCPSAHHGSVGYAQIGGVEEFSVVAGVVLLVEKCEESEVSELRSGVSKAASHRRGYVSSFWNFSDAGSDRARCPNKGKMAK